jgi:hypothetical protein
MSHDRRKEIGVSRLVNLVVYRVKKGKDEEFKKLLAQHWPTLNKAGLVKPEPAKIWRGVNIRSDHQGSSWIEMFSWKTEDAGDIAHQMPEVMKIWEPMTPILDGMDIYYMEPEQL